MCGIVGFATEKLNNNNYNLLNKIILQSQIRGLHSFGYTYYDAKLITVKHHNIKDVQLPKTNKLIYHNRYSTSGDYTDHRNNQPIHVNDVSLVFNGVVYMSTQDEMQTKYNIEMETYNDGEIIIQKCAFDKNKIQNFIENMHGSFAGLMMFEDKIYVIRNERRPAWIVKKFNSTYIASTKDIFLRADSSLEPKELKPNKIYEL